MRVVNQWQLAGNAAELDEDVLVPTLFKPWAADLVELADLRPGERVLDVACGTGVVARLAAQHVATTGEITGLDPTWFCVSKEFSSSLTSAPRYRSSSVCSSRVAGCSSAVGGADAIHRRDGGCRGAACRTRRRDDAAEEPRLPLTQQRLQFREMFATVFGAVHADRIAGRLKLLEQLV